MRHIRLLLPGVASVYRFTYTMRILAYKLFFCIFLYWNFVF